MIISGKPVKLPTESMDDFIVVLCEYLYQMNCRIADIEKKLQIVPTEFIIPDKVQSIMDKNAQLFYETIHAKKSKEDAEFEQFCDDCPNHHHGEEFGCDAGYECDKEKCYPFLMFKYEKEKKKNDIQ